MSDTCQWLHERLKCLPLIQFPFELDRLPNNGIYCFYERGERWGHGGPIPRVVRIGTHKDGNFRSRISEHYLLVDAKMKFDETKPAPKDRSIFRKNLGRALLNKNKDESKKLWEVDFTRSDNRAKYKRQRDIAHEMMIERKITDFIGERFSFRFVSVPNERTRIGSSGLESALIGTCAGCETCRPSNKWLGLYSPKPLIQDSGLWLVQHLSAPCLSARQIKRLDGLIVQTERMVKFR